MSNTEVFEMYMQIDGSTKHLTSTFLVRHCPSLAIAKKNVLKIKF